MSFSREPHNHGGSRLFVPLVCTAWPSAYGHSPAERESA
jgi:hypothetical protein